MGEFEGTFTPAGGQAVKAEAKVLADQDHNYRVAILYPAGEAKATRIEFAGKGADGVVSLTGADWNGKKFKDNWTGKVTKDTLNVVGVGQHGGTAEMKRVVRTSPTLGQKPPKGAVVLLPFEEGKPTNLDLWANKTWHILPDGTVQVGQGDNKSVRDFASFKAHVEFCVPFAPAARGQGRGNSGVYLHGRYEIQVLDSFGLAASSYSQGYNPPGSGECAAIYDQRAPLVNSSLPPGVWQTYDIEFQAPKFDASGKQTHGALITVLHNGVKVLDAVETKNVTGGAWGQPGKTGPLRLQDHNNPTKFRNIWVVELP
jgi:hypothetical protein